MAAATAKAPVVFETTAAANGNDTAATGNVEATVVTVIQLKAARTMVDTFATAAAGVAAGAAAAVAVTRPTIAFKMPSFACSYKALPACPGSALGRA